MGEPHPISAAHGQGIRSLIDAALEDFPDDHEDERATEDGPVPLAVARRPNVGQSTLSNTWPGGEGAVWL